MDEGKATGPGPAPKWWSRPRRGPAQRAPATGSDDAAPTAGPPGGAGPPTADGHAAGTQCAADTASSTGAPSAAEDMNAGFEAGENESAAEGRRAAEAGREYGNEAQDRSVPQNLSAPEDRPVPEDGPAPPDRDAEAPGPGADADERAPVQEPARPHVPGARVPGVPGARAPGPLHGADPYATPPYGGPGPWAPAPPVQLPSATPPHGVAVPPAAATTPPYGVPTGPHGPWAPHAPRGPVPAGPAPPMPVPPQAVAGVAEVTGGAGHTGAGQAAVVPRVPLPPVPPPAPGGPAPRRRRRLKTVVGAVVLALVAGGAGGLAGAYIERNGSVSDVKLPQTPEERAGGDKGKDRPKGSIAGIARQALPGVVTLHARGGGAGATGTGFVLDRRGHILTNSHVVESARGEDSVQVTFNSGQAAAGEVVGRDGGYDLAVVKVSGVAGLKPLALGNSDAVRVGDPVVAIGAPFDLDGTVTTGIVSAKDRPITAGGEEGSEMSYVDALQTDAPINPGNSGGPLVDTKGRVIGINSAIKGAGSDGGLSGESGGSVGLGFAIPVNQGRRIAEELINDGRATHPVIGITLDMQYGGDGARVGDPGGGAEAAVEPGGPADKAGLKEGDVITRAGGREVHSGEELMVRIRSHRPGDKLKLNVRRDGKERSVRVTLGSSTG